MSGYPPTSIKSFVYNTIDALAYFSHPPRKCSGSALQYKSSLRAIQLMYQCLHAVLMACAYCDSSITAY